MTSPARLIARYGTQPSQEYILSQPVTTIGREPVNDISLNDSEVSRRHARITIVAGIPHLEDLGSTNGTFVNGQRVVMTTPLKHDDIIDFAETQRFRFVAAGVEDTPPVNFKVEYPATVVDDQPAAYPPPPAYPEPSYPPTQLDAGPAGAVPGYVPTQIDAQPVSVAPPAYAAPPSDVDWDATAAETGRGRTPMILGCVLLLILAVIILAVVIVILDGYNNGELLYCGPLRPLFEFIASSSGQVLACP